ncbi:glycosyltransferase family 4 protein [Collinsella sp. LCP19S3_A7]|uniref:glycosyltransferase family 4 protein n=1 Tax=Collinsella sp. LCP19S3_A7 TaxID=3438753 RepID=UPI003F8E907A
MRIAMIGHKRFGSREGGVEVVVTELARRMAALGHEVTCYDRSGSDVMTGDAAETRERIVDGVRVVPVKTIDKKGLAAASASYYATKAAIADKPDVIHFHAEGPCTCLPMARRAGIRTVATIHGLDWQRAKWGRLGSAYIKHGEKAAAESADEIIVLSRSAQDYFEQTYNRSTVFIPNGMNPKEYRPVGEIEKRWGLEKNSYILFLGRLVPEKRPELLIDAFKSINTTNKCLVIAGGSSDTSEYVRQLHERAKGDSRILFTGFVTGKPLAELYSNAYCYVLPSDVEGMPMSLLEAMAYGCACVTSDISECSDVLAETGAVFTRGDVAALREVLTALLSNPAYVAKLGAKAKARLESEYDWDSVVERTLGVYKGVIA